MSSPKVPNEDSSNAPIPILPFDAGQRYDLYCWVVSEQRLYENVKIVAIRTFDKIDKVSAFSSAIGGLFEIEAQNGAKMMIPRHGINLICKHGDRPVYKVVGRRLPPGNEGDSWKEDT
jgi:hypothetical protein